MKYASFILITSTLFHLSNALEPLLFRNDADKKVRISLFYKRYNNVGPTKKYEKRTHKFTAYIKKNKILRVSLRKKNYDDLTVSHLIATNTKRRNDWDGLTLKELENKHLFIVQYDTNRCLKVSSTSLEDKFMKE